MSGKGTAVGGGILATLMAFGVAFARDLGPFADDIGRGADDVGRVVTKVHPPAGAVDALDDPMVSAAAKESIKLFRKMQQGTANEKAVAKATCTVLNAGLTAQDEEALKGQITEQVKADTGAAAVSWLQDRYATQAAHLITVTDYNPRAGYYYARYCVHP